MLTSQIANIIIGNMIVFMTITIIMVIKMILMMIMVVMMIMTMMVMLIISMISMITMTTMIIMMLTLCLYKYLFDFYHTRQKVSLVLMHTFAIK